MIERLCIKNIALIDELELEFRDGLNILSGETGAGKTIILDSINFVLGDRADKSLIRHGQTSAKVEMVFSAMRNSARVAEILEKSGLESDDGVVIVSRTMNRDRSECRINRQIVNLSLLKDVVNVLVDTHSQNEHQILLKPSEHIRILDEYNGEISELLASYRKSLDYYSQIKAKIEQMPSEDSRLREADLLKYQIAEIESGIWTEEEIEELLRRRSAHRNGQKIAESVELARRNACDGDGFDAASALKVALRALTEAARFDKSLERLVRRLDSVAIELNDIASELRGLSECGVESEEEIEKVEDRLEAVRLLKKKYGKTPSEATEFLMSAKARLSDLDGASARLSELRAERRETERSLIEKATKLHEMRKEASEKFGAEMTSALVELGMTSARFEIRFEFEPERILSALNRNGAEKLEFMLSPNLGEPPMPLAKIASGGELSRFMLATKSIISAADDVDTLIFDEVDAGISGKTATVVAQKLCDISRRRQVISITHLPQIAAMGDANYLIEKFARGGKTVTEVTALSPERVCLELMRLSGAIEDSEAGHGNAVELKARADEYKRGTDAC